MPYGEEKANMLGGTCCGELIFESHRANLKRFGTGRLANFSEASFWIDFV
jgi:hypothetical protein